MTIENSVKDTADNLDTKKDEVWEKSNKQVTFLVYKEGDQLNVFRIVDREDGTMTPVSKSIRFVQVKRDLSYKTTKIKYFFLN